MSRTAIARIVLAVTIIAGISCIEGGTHYHAPPLAITGVVLAAGSPFAYTWWRRGFVAMLGAFGIAFACFHVLSVLRVERGRRRTTTDDAAFAAVWAGGLGLIKYLARRWARRFPPLPRAAR